jgi:hypothetical protein
MIFALNVLKMFSSYWKVQHGIQRKQGPARAFSSSIPEEKICWLALFTKMSRAPNSSICAEMTFSAAPFVVRSTGMSRILLDELFVISVSSDYALESVNSVQKKKNWCLHGDSLYFLFGQVYNSNVGSFTGEEDRYSATDSLCYVRSA